MKNARTRKTASISRPNRTADRSAYGTNTSPDPTRTIDGLVLPVVRRPVVVAIDDNGNWAVMIPTLAGRGPDGRRDVIYKPAEGCIFNFPRPANKVQAIRAGNALAAQIGGGIALDFTNLAARRRKRAQKRIARPRPAQSPLAKPRQDETFNDYLQRLWGPNWAIANKTPRNLTRYGRCVTRREYLEARNAWEK